MGTKMGEKHTFRIRLRVRIGMPLTTDQETLVAEISGREVIIKPQHKEQSLREATWIVLLCGGFKTECAAHQFGERLRQIVQIGALCTRLGVDVGEDKPTLVINEEWARSIGLIKDYERILPNIHGLMVMPDDELTRIPSGGITLTGTADPAPLVEALRELGYRAPLRVAGTAASVRNLNLALMSRESLARIVLAISTVEALGQSETWTEEQTTLLAALANQVEHNEANDLSSREVADALRRSIHRIGLRQGVKRVLSRLGLGRLLKEWDRIYDLRSNVFHGRAHLSDLELSELANASIALCGTVILSVLKSEGTQLPTISKVHFPVE